MLKSFPTSNRGREENFEQYGSSFILKNKQKFLYNNL